MEKSRRRALGRGGFTLIEMVVSMAVLGVVSWLLMDLLTRGSRTYTVVDNLSETQQNVRAIADLLEGELRATGFLVQEAGAVCGHDTAPGTPDATPDVLYVTDSESLDPTGMADLEDGVNISGTPSQTGTSVGVTVDSLILDGNGFYDLNGDGTGDSDFQFTAAPLRTGGVIIFDRSNPDRGTACGLITNIATSGGSFVLTVDFTTQGAAPGGTAIGALAMGATPDLVAVPAHAYWIGVGPNGSPALMRDGMVLAEDVEDLQLALHYDLDDDGVVDGLPVAFPTGPPFHSATEYPGSSAANASYQSGAWNNQDLREIRVNLVARTRSADPDALVNPNTAIGTFQATENRVPPGTAVDGFRRRVLTLTVRPRNIGSRTAGV
jgi:prepilin-type N-terminal cleavage/methylation domain-containing protein